MTVVLFSSCGEKVSDTTSTESGMTMSGSMMGHEMSMMSVNSDEEFIAKMIPHHEEAVISSKNLLEVSKNEALRTIAQNIITAQQTEIAQMKGWSISWFGKDVTDRNQYMQMMPKLTGLSEEELDKAYVTGMIAHHQGAVDMAQDLLKFTKRPELIQVAKDIITAQTKEIEKFREMLK